jgi:hypothetical protein
MSTSERIIIGVALLALVAAVVCFGILFHRNRPIGRSSATVSAVAGPSTAASQPLTPSYLEVQAGQIGVLDTGFGGTDVAATPTVLYNLYGAAQKNDVQTYRRYFKKGLAITVDDGTRAKLLVSGDWYNQVEVADGPYAGRKGWIAMKWIRPVGSLPQKDRQ